MKRGKPPAEVEARNIPRITRLMALTLRFNHLLREGVTSPRTVMTTFAGLLTNLTRAN